jgi:hypothetical protein
MKTLKIQVLKKSEYFMQNWEKKNQSWGLQLSGKASA